jgi:hypothetical protein
MTDFIADLETELVAAARRRATRRRMPRPRLVPVVAAIAIVVAAVAVLRGVDGSRTADDRPVPPGPGVVVTLPAAEPTDDGGCRPAKDAEIPGKPQLAVFERPQTVDERIQPPGYGALPVDLVDNDSLRATGVTDRFRVVRVGGLSGDCDAARRPLDPGVCLIVGRESVAARCFGDQEVARGTAIAVAPLPAAKTTDWVFGIAPDGVERVKLTWAGGTVTARVADNGYDARLDGVKAGDQVRIELERPEGGCDPSQKAIEAAPAVVEGELAGRSRALEDAMAEHGNGGAWRAYARVVTVRDGLKVWVVPDMPCDRATDGPERVCILPTGGSLLCGRPSSVQRRGISIQFGQGALTTVAGIAPSGVRYADVRVRDVVDSVPVKDGVFGARIVDRSNDPVDITYR